MESFAHDLGREISKGLPGTEVQWAMASSDRLVKDFPRVPRKDSANAAVLLLFYPHSGKINTVFIQRPDYDGVHGGQISFPGGKREKDDQDAIFTALREAAEEIDIRPSDVKIIGTLTPLFIPVSNILVTPVVGWTGKRPLFKPDPSEVLFIIEAELALFLENSIIRTRPWEVRGESINIRYFDYDGHMIWGATAMILHELLTLIKRAHLSLKV
ncbi:MAG: CoA pyrophosphatase [Bacteroidales bacterium]|jgi:8-oxo-dGTP pyrophosphatase MutT (NUDIX family)